MHITIVGPGRNSATRDEIMETYKDIRPLLEENSGSDDVLYNLLASIDFAVEDVLAMKRHIDDVRKKLDRTDALCYMLQQNAEVTDSIQRRPCLNIERGNYWGDDVVVRATRAFRIVILHDELEVYNVRVIDQGFEEEPVDVEIDYKLRPGFYAVKLSYLNGREHTINFLVEDD